LSNRLSVKATKGWRGWVEGLKIKAPNGLSASLHLKLNEHRVIRAAHERAIWTEWMVSHIWSQSKIQKKIPLILPLNIINLKVFFLINVIRGLIIESQVKDEKYHVIKMIIFFL
jgi:hypothetical protein